MGGIRRAKARDIDEWNSGDNRPVYACIDLHKSTFNAAVVDDDGNLLRETKGKCEPDGTVARFYEKLRREGRRGRRRL